MSNLVPFNQLVADTFKGVHNFNTHTIKAVLTNSPPSLNNTILSNITEIAAGNGYTAGGATVSIASVSQSSGTLSVLSDADIVWTATGGSIAPFRYVVFYNDTPASPLDPLIGYVDYGSSITINDTENFTVPLNGVNLFGGSIDEPV